MFRKLVSCLFVCILIASIYVYSDDNWAPSPDGIDTRLNGYTQYLAMIMGASTTLDTKPVNVVGLQSVGLTVFSATGIYNGMQFPGTVAEGRLGNATITIWAEAKTTTPNAAGTIDWTTVPLTVAAAEVGIRSATLGDGTIDSNVIATGNGIIDLVTSTTQFNSYNVLLGGNKAWVRLMAAGTAPECSVGISIGRPDGVKTFQ